MNEFRTSRNAAEIRRLAAITHGYDYFATIWLDGPLRLDEPALQTWLAQLASIEPVLAARLGGLVRLLDGDDERTAADEDFQACLVVPQPGRYLPPYASVWTGSTDELWSPTTMRAVQCYAQAGLDWQHAAHSGDRPWVRAPDHVGIECAFIAELTTASARLRADEPDSSGRADPGTLAASFVVDHVRTWVPAYAARLADHARSLYWQDAAEVIATWVRYDSLLPSDAGSSSTAQVLAAATRSQPPPG